MCFCFEPTTATRHKCFCSLSFFLFSKLDLFYCLADFDSENNEHKKSNTVIKALLDYLLDLEQLTTHKQTHPCVNETFLR